MNKISKVCFIIMGGLLSLSIPTFFTVSSLLSHKSKITPAKAAISELAPTNLTLTPVNNEDVKDLADGSYYFMAVVNELYYTGSSVYEGALYAYDETEVTEVPISIGSDLSINIDENLPAVIASMVEFRTPDADSFDIINKSIYRYIGADFNSYYNDWYFTSGVERQYSTFGFAQNNDEQSYTVSITSDYNGDMVTGYLYYNSNHAFEFNQNDASKVCIYQLPDGFYEEYSWSAKLNAITDADNADDLLETWQNLPVYEKDNLFMNFFEGEGDDSGSGSNEGPDYNQYNGVLAEELQALTVKYKLYKTIVGAEYEHPFACKDIDENIAIDNGQGTISGFSTINRLVYMVESDEPYNYYSSFKVNPTGSYLFAYESDDGISANFTGKTVHFYYGLGRYESTLSSEPLTVTFREKQNNGSLPDEEPVPAELIYDINTATGQTSSTEYNFDDCFMLESIPEGYDIAVVTEGFYEAYSSFIEEEPEGFPLNLVHYFSENKPIEYASDENGENTRIMGETTYYILYRLSGNMYSLFSDCCGYKTFTTGEESSTSYLVKAENYESYIEFKESDRFAQYINDCEGYYNGFYDTIISEINELSEPVDYDEFREKMSIADRWYIEASRIMLLYDYYINDYSSSRTMEVVETLNEGLDAFVIEYTPLDREAVDDYVDTNLVIFEDTYVLYSTQEDAARRMVDYFNSLIDYYLFTGDLTGAIAILKSYTDDIYECDDYNEIGTYETNYRIEIKDWFIEHA